ncbi:hypothetical protein DUNSADRAFT_10554 [Dunaliella salina]|uniref:AMP-dependent synthetase/ligase domain-containing protein n=1 Tax=Dunaliella salina TaxID=3046 RepID=A0ABQ7GF27_DUNSA|nr:hypothetical protein DUNSADRAFT_10554 [Dunaliella salina]|eukprot:KAF5833204.1 hypothetical protein DUNSADRAFT_10554 [Dunaliella salina]
MVGAQVCVTEVSGPRAQGARPSASPVYRPNYARDGCPQLEVGTCYEMFRKSAFRFPNNPALGYRPEKPKEEEGLAHSSEEGQPAKKKGKPNQPEAKQGKENIKKEEVSGEKQQMQDGKETDKPEAEQKQELQPTEKKDGEKQKREDEKHQREDEKQRKKEEDRQRKQEQRLQREEEKERKKEAKQLEREAKKKEAEARKQEQEARKQEAAAKRIEADPKKQEAEAKKKEAEAKKQEAQAKKQGQRAQEQEQRGAKQQRQRPGLEMDPALPYEFMTYAQAEKFSAEIHGGMQQCGVMPHDHIGTIGINCPEYMLSIQAMNRMSAVCVPLYETLGENAIEYIIQHSGAKMVVSQGSKLAAVAKALARGAKDVVTSGVVFWGKANPKDVESVQSMGVAIMSWEDLLNKGRSQPMPEPVPPKPEDLCTIMYTSGTTGPPKGVMITHNSMVHTIAGVKLFMEHQGETLGPNDVFLSYLPLAHIFDRVVEEYMLYVGGSIGYWQGDVKKLMDDLAALKPTLFVGVPRVFERICGGINDLVAKGNRMKRAIFRYAYNRKHFYMERGFGQGDQSTPAMVASHEERLANNKASRRSRPRQGFRQHKASPISDMLVFNKIKAKLGGRVRVIVSGGAPLPEQAEAFLKVAMCAPVVQGYGLTETCAASFISNPFDKRHGGTVGAPLAHTDLRLESVPEMGYDANPTDGSPPRGEILIRGPGVFRGYYKAETMSKEVIDDDGFFHTGDVGELLPWGSLRIIDRIKNIFKLAHGEYVAVERVENAYKMCPIVDQLWVYGSSFENFLVAVVIPKEENLKQQTAQQQNMPHVTSMDFKQLVALPEARSTALKMLQETGKASKLKGFEIIKAVHLDTEPFTVENDMITPSFKLKRPQLLKKYQDAVSGMYAQLKAEQ